MPQVEVACDLESSGILNVTAKRRVAGNAMSQLRTTKGGCRSRISSVWCGKPKNSKPVGLSRGAWARQLQGKILQTQGIREGPEQGRPGPEGKPCKVEGFILQDLNRAARPLQLRRDITQNRWTLGGSAQGRSAPSALKGNPAKPKGF